MTKTTRLIRGSLAVTLSFLLVGCGGGDAQQGGGAGGPPGAGPPPLVVAMTVQAQDVPNIVELPGRIEATRTSEVRARADGIVERRLYQEGTDVRAGQPLFQIDRRDLLQQVAQARAAVARSEAARSNAASVVRRYTPLIKERAVSGQEFDQANASLRSETANVADARAALARAQLQLGYTTVRAPIAGRAGRAQVTEGALVSATQATLLTTIEQAGSVYAVFTQSNAAILDMRTADRSGGGEMAPLSQVEVRLLLANGREYGPVGRLDFADQTVDPQTGSQVLRAVFPNGERLLLPGQFVRGRIAIGTKRGGIVLPSRAVQIGDRGATVFVVGADGSATPRPVQIAGQVAGGWSIKSGLKPGERVITDGWQKVQPGMKVQVKGDPAPAGQAGAPKGGQ
ncbi:efflux RND transporter periplasmic adaptor subunit [Sphingomonas donggukensis]|uniref:Efflux RND transporter periplasmic adaptor subunit n=1 Tax=Sphingomonas donggukensis TaxID=2949093 RepID=A0ABY4TVN2_9SPHN|nr:efflux RND transporter periplasmic adaptor subunit [Sphingomonas donggukensis]URW76398.1 efflux RND transporter periplasmic adaptor subunit [Sphingomonas donggukensis]